MHREWKELSKHEVVSMEQIQSNVKQLVPPKKVTLYCSLHEGMKHDLYCETCGELICLHCTVKKHKDHQYDLVGDTFQRHKAEITASLEPVEKQLGTVSEALEQFGLRSQELDDLEVALEANIGQEIRMLQELLEARKAELVSQMKQLIQTKRKNLTAQKDEVETVHTQLASCLSFVRESLRTGSQGEVMKMKKGVVKQIKEMTDNFKPDMLPPCEPANVKFIASPELTQACQQFGRVLFQQISPEKCYATGKGLEVAELGERATAVLHVVDQKGKAYSTPVETLTCELVSESTGEKIDCSVKKTEAGGQYEISYQAINRGRHHLHIKVVGEHIKGSQFPVTVKVPIKKLGTPTKTISGVKSPWGVAVNWRGEVSAAEAGAQCISIFSPTGEKLRSFGSRGSEHGQFNSPRGVAVDDDGNILVADKGNHRIQKFTTDGKFIMSVGKKGSNPLEFNQPMGVAIHPLNKRVYIVEHSNHRIQILNPDLTFSSNFGIKGSGNGQFNTPRDVAFDSAGNVYVADFNNNCIQVFTAEGQFLKNLAMMSSSGDGELDRPTGVSIDSEDVVYVAEYGNHRVSVFTCEGKFLVSFGKHGRGPGQLYHPRGIAVDKNGVIYVSDNYNSRLQIF
jgi:tripartite motif-containing protein 2/3/tripartite motif-containing protein 71